MTVFFAKMRQIFRMLCLVILCHMFLPGSGKTEDLMTIYTLALEHDPQFRQARFDQLSSKEGVKQSYAGLLPSVTFDAESGGIRQNVRSTNNDLYTVGASKFMTHRIGITINQPVFRLSAIAGVRQAQAEARRSDLAFQLAQQTLILRTATLYFQALLARDEVIWTEADFTALQVYFKAVQIQREKGLASRAEMEEARARLAEVEANAIEAQTLWANALLELRGICGQIPTALAGLGEAVPMVAPDPSSVAAWVAAAAEYNLELLAQRQRVESLRQEVSRQKTSRYPALDLIVRGNREKTGGSLFGGGSDLETANVALHVSLPLYQGGFVSARTRDAVYHYQSALMEINRVRLEVDHQVRRAHAGVVRAMAQVDARHQALMARQRVLDAHRDGYLSGASSSLDVLDAERRLFQAHRQHAQARYDYILNSLRLKQTAGQIQKADLKAVNRWLGE